jgi:glycosyltransferase involved in cell wall biosynthesis
MKTISVTTPCFNEEANVRDCYEAVKTLFDGPLSTYRREHVFADNCSTDRTADILREIAAADPDVKVIINARNFGPLRSTYNAVLATSGDAVLLFLPADMQDPPSLLPEFVKLWEQDYEIVYGIRATRAEGWVMRSIRYVYYRIISKFSYVAFPPDVGDFQLVDRKVLDAMRKTEDAYPFMRMMTFESGFRAVGVRYHWEARKKGFSKNNFFNLIDQGLNGIITFTTVPLRAALFLGMVVSVFSLIYAFFTLAVSLLSTGKVAESGIPTLIVALFFFAGIQIFFMGLLGEYILAIYGQVRKKPLVIERERINFTAKE